MHKKILNINNIEYKFTNFHIPLESISKSKKLGNTEDKEEEVITEKIPSKLIAKKIIIINLQQEAYNHKPCSSNI